MSALEKIEQGIERLLMQAPYYIDPCQRHDLLLALLKQELAYACDRNPRFRNYVEQWPVDFRVAEQIADLPYLPVGVFKQNPPLTLIGSEEIKRVLVSSATTGQSPSRVILDTATAKRMAKGLVTIIRDFIGPSRRPYLVVDTPENLLARTEMGARSAAIQGLNSFATEVVSCLRASAEGDLSLDRENLLSAAARWKFAEVLVYGFTFVIWTQLVRSLLREGLTLALPQARVLHSGGWKRLEQQAVSRQAFSRGVAAVFGCSEDRVLDYYGMVENVGVVYPDCAYGNKHVPAFAEIIVRDPLTLAPVGAGQRGLIQVCSVLPTSFPGFLVLTEDLADVQGLDQCPCGRRGLSFRFAGRAPKAELRGCGNIEDTRYPQERKAGVA
jgi:hypothetical protein